MDRGTLVSLCLVLLMAASYLTVWLVQSRGAGWRTITPQSQPPADAAVGYLTEMGIVNTAFSATIVNAAINDCLRSGSARVVHALWLGPGFLMAPGCCGGAGGLSPLCFLAPAACIHPKGAGMHETD